MQTTIYILSTLLILVFIGLFALGRYRNYVFDKKSTPELNQMLREHKKSYNRLSQQQRQSTYGKLLQQSITAIERKLKERHYAKAS